MYKVIEVAKLLSVSKVTIYKKISANKEALKNHIVKKKNITYLNDDAIEIIRKSLPVHHVNALKGSRDLDMDQVEQELNHLRATNKALIKEKIILFNEALRELESTIGHLTNQLQVKKNHLKTKEEILVNFKESMKLNKDRIKLIDALIENFKGDA